MYMRSGVRFQLNAMATDHDPRKEKVQADRHTHFFELFKPIVGHE